MHRVRLVRLVSSHNNLRTPVVEGFCAHLPEVGRSFLLRAAPLLAGDFRVVATSTVTAVGDNDGADVLFTTLNSTYRLEYLPCDA